MCQTYLGASETYARLTVYQCQTLANKFGIYDLQCYCMDVWFGCILQF
jgi:hypothetical protein